MAWRVAGQEGGQRWGKRVGGGVKDRLTKSAGLCGLVVIVRTNNLLRGALLVLPALAVAGVVLWLGSLLAGAPRTGETITYQFSFSAMIAVAWLIGALAIELVDRCLKASGEELRE